MYRRADRDDIRHVFTNVAPERVAEACATAFHDNMLQLAEELILIGDRAWLFALSPKRDMYRQAERNPAFAIVGVVEFGPFLGGMIWMATPEWTRSKIASHRWWRDDFMPMVLEKFRRVEFTALASDTASRRWLKSLGFTEEGLAYRQGKRGEDFVHCAWLNPDPTVGVVHS